jgi:hypothetical protein
VAAHKVERQREQGSADIHDPVAELDVANNNLISPSSSSSSSSLMPDGLWGSACLIGFFQGENKGPSSSSAKPAKAGGKKGTMSVHCRCEKAVIY